jgi:cobalt-zinc-cadmium efflux system membrane fusion protein
MSIKKYLVIIFTTIMAISCNNKKESTENNSEHEVLPPNVVEMNDDQYKLAGLELGLVEHKELGSELEVNGVINVSPQNIVSVSAIMGGYVKSTRLLQGSPVSKGQVIAIIENPEFIELQQNYLENQSRLEYAENEYNRQKDLFNENVNSEKTYQSALSEFKSLQVKVFALLQKLKLIGIDAKKLKVENISSTVSIFSPISGYVKNVNVNIGKYVSPTDVIAEIVITQNLTLELSVFEKDIHKVSIGQKISFSSPNDPGKEMNAVISQVGKSINEDKTIKVYATVEKTNSGLFPGMYVNASIKIMTSSVSALPNDAILTFEDKNYIFVFSERKKEGDKFVTLFEIIEVKKGFSGDVFSEVILPSDFKPNETKIVIKGAYNLLSALKNAGDMAC